MSPSTERWPDVEAALQALGAGNRSGDIHKIRSKFGEMAGRGHHLMPDFTQHNVTHSDNLILILADLKAKFGFELKPYEAYLLAASAYLHDLGMFFSKNRFLTEISPDPHAAFRFCPDDACDQIDYDQVQRRPLGEQIRLTHNVLSAYWLDKVEPATFGLERKDVPHVITIARGHRKTDLRSTDCECYQTEPIDGVPLRFGLLAGLLRLADALDFYQNRAPAVAFEQGALDFLSNPVALEHWIKHYFVTDPYVARHDEGGDVRLECQLHVTVPMGMLNDVLYLDFFRPLFEAHVNEARSSGLDRDQYPPEFTEALGITRLEIRPVERTRRGFRDLPPEVLDEIQRSGCRDVMAFLEWLKNPPRQWDEPPVLDRDKEKGAFRAMLRGERPERLMLVAGESGQGKSYLLRDFEVIAAEEGARLLHLGLEDPDLAPAALLDRLADWLGWAHFETYRVARAEDADRPPPGSAEERTARQGALTEAFLAGAAGVPLMSRALLLDTYEQAGDELQTWLEAEFLVHWTQTTDAVAVVAGRQIPDLQPKQACRFTLTGLPVHEYRPLVISVGLRLSDETLGTLHTISEGRPLDMVTHLRKLATAGGSA
jgi:hypothetical protein